MKLHPAFEVCGCDVSYWQTAVNYVRLTAMGARFIIARSSIGNKVDTRYKQHTQAAPIPFGAYHFWQPIYLPEQNAQTMSAAQPTRPAMACWLDLESQAGNMTRSQTSEHIYKTLMLIDGHYDALTGIYSNQSSWLRLVDPAYYDRLQLDKRPLWVANYFQNFTLAPHLPAGWPGYTIWQFSAEIGPYSGRASEFGISGSKSLDIDAFNGSEADFQKFIGASVTPPIPPYFSTHVVTTQVCNPRNRANLDPQFDAGTFIKSVLFEKAGAMEGDFQPVKVYLHKTVIEDV